MIETCFDKFDKLEAAIGKPISIANRKRMNNKRTIDGFRYNNKSQDQEFGTTEAKAKYNVSSEHFKDAFVQLPMALKDMLDDLIKDQPNLASINHFRQSVSSILDSPLQCLLKTDRPVTSPESLDKSQ
ncbi:hypothetical protein G6F42_021832 [Rhizopus arrhizus]|nr:hypothetical protein G6F42_021832 [Rhizopus arrhizus]